MKHPMNNRELTTVCLLKQKRLVLMCATMQVVVFYLTFLTKKPLQPSHPITLQLHHPVVGRLLFQMMSVSFSNKYLTLLQPPQHYQILRRCSSRHSHSIETCKWSVTLCHFINNHYGICSEEEELNEVWKSTKEKLAVDYKRKCKEVRECVMEYSFVI